MKKRIGGYVFTGGIAVLTAACVDRPAAPPMPTAPERPLLAASTPFNGAGQCLGNDAITWRQFVGGLDETSTPESLSCVANDIVVTSVVATEYSPDGVTWFPGGDPITCVAGQVIFFRVKANLANQAANGADVGLWLSPTGGNAKVGSCLHYNIPGNALPPDATNPDGDSCGNVAAGSSPALVLGELQFVCIPGPIQIGTCLAWSTDADQRECPVPTVSGANGFRAGTLPSFKDRCSCQTNELQFGSPQIGSITIVTDAVPDDPQDF